MCFDYLTDSKISEAIPAFSPSNVIALLFVTRDLLDTRHWEVIGSRPPVEVGQGDFISAARNNKFKGVTVIGSQNLVRFLNAFHGLQPWDAMYDPHYYDSLLIDACKKPSADKLLFQNLHQELE